MGDEKMLPFEQQFDEKPTRIGGFVLTQTAEDMHVYIHEGVVDCPVYAPEEFVEEFKRQHDGEEPEPFLLSLTPREARDLAGLLIYASGRAEEHAAHCLDCGNPMHQHEDDTKEGEQP